MAVPQLAARCLPSSHHVLADIELFPPSRHRDSSQPSAVPQPPACQKGAATHLPHLSLGTFAPDTSERPLLWCWASRNCSESIYTNSPTQDLLGGVQILVELAEGLPNIAFHLSVLELLGQRHPVLVVGDAGLEVGGHLTVEMAESLRDVELTCVVEGRERDGFRDLTGIAPR